MSDVVLVDATTLIALGNVGRIQLLENFDGDIVVPETVKSEIATESARTNLTKHIDTGQYWLRDDTPDSVISRAQELLGDDNLTGDVQIVEGVSYWHRVVPSVAVVSDDRRVRTVSRGIGATVTGTVGVIVRAVDEGMVADEAKDLIREIDSHGLHMTGELREKAFNLIDDAAEV